MVAMSKAKCWIGYGQGNEAVDDLLTLSMGGIDRLARRIGALGVEVEIQRWYDAQEIYNEIRATPPDTKIILGGASLTANQTPLNASYAYPRKVAYIFGIQPSLSGNKSPIPANVEFARCFVTPIWAPTSLYWWLGAYKWTLAVGNKTTKLSIENTYAHHPGSNDERVQSTIINDIKAVLAK